MPCHLCNGTSGENQVWGKRTFPSGQDYGDILEKRKSRIQKNAFLKKDYKSKRSKVIYFQFETCNNGVSFLKKYLLGKKAQFGFFSFRIIKAWDIDQNIITSG